MAAFNSFLVLVIATVFIISTLPAVTLTTTSQFELHRVFPVKNEGVEVLKARDKARHARILQGIAVGGVVDFYVSGMYDPYVAGIYYTKVKLGSPPREFNVQIDTGSDALWINCNSCIGCPQSSGLGVELSFYDVSISSTASLVPCSHPICSTRFQTTASECLSPNNQCSYSFQYQDGSGTSGYYVSDMLHFDMVMGNSFISNSSAPIVFGCSNYQSGPLTKTDKAIDGIFGFGRQDLSVISQLSSRGITPKVFSHCLRGDASGGGILVLGEILEPSIVYSPLVPSHTAIDCPYLTILSWCELANVVCRKGAIVGYDFLPHYNLVLQSIAVNGQLLPIKPGVFATSTNRGTIIDSGTTLTYLVEEAYDPFVSAVSATVSQFVTLFLSKEIQCYLVSTSIRNLFPLVSLNFAGGASMLLKPEDYLMKMGLAEGGEEWCIGFQKAQDHGITILGDLVLKDKIFVYDLARQRIGWTNFDCSSSVNVSVFSSKDELMNAGQLSVSSSYRYVFYKLALLIQALVIIGLSGSWFHDILRGFTVPLLSICI